MENVPVKISENYKPLPKILIIPQAVTTRLNTKQGYYNDLPQFIYNFELEKKVLSDIAEWKKYRKVVQNNQQKRKERREQQKCRDIEDKNKKLLTAISYPSTEDFSFESDNDFEKNKDLTPRKCTDTMLQDIKMNSNLSTVLNSFNTILQPTVLSHDSSINTCSMTPLYENNKINYSDFENDTSSPFDNIELKTINDLDILAQVLHNSRVQNVADKKEQEVSTTSKTVEDDNQLQTGNNNFVLNNSNTHLSINATNIPQMIQQSYVFPENQLSRFYIPNTNSEAYIGSQIQHKHLTFNCNSEYNGTVDRTPQYLIGKKLPLTQFNQHSNNSNIIFPVDPSYHANDNSVTSFSGKPYNCNWQATEYKITSLSNDNKFKSQSVPDILKHLKVKKSESDAIRVRNYSDTLENTNSENTNNADAFQTKCLESEYYKTLDPNIQSLAQNISSMGYPFERVLKVAYVIGRDDKKIVEHLILLDELIELGFEESKISEALIKFDHNKEKALDFLIR